MLATVTFTVALDRDLDLGDSLDPAILTEVALDQLIDDRDEKDFVSSYVVVTTE